MTTQGFEAVLRAAAALLLVISAAACATAPGQTQISSSEGQIHGWVDWAALSSDAPRGYALISNQGAQGN